MSTAPPSRGTAPPPRGTAVASIALAALTAVALLAACEPTGSSGAGAGPAEADDPLIVAAAADLRPAFEALGERFEAETGEEVTFVFGSSGQLAQQAIEGAPMDVYASANVAYVDDVLASGRGDPDTQATYAYGRIALWATDAAWRDWEDVEALATDPDVGSLAIANPEHAPYGQAAREALAHAGVWDDVEEQLVYGENIADAHRLASSGNADAVITALSLAIGADEGVLDGQAEDGRWRLVDADAHQPLQQDLLVVADDPARAERAQDLVALVDSAQGREIMRDYGFLLPDEDPPPAWEG